MLMPLHRPILGFFRPAQWHPSPSPLLRPPPLRTPSQSLPSAQPLPPGRARQQPSPTSPGWSRPREWFISLAPNSRWAIPTGRCLPQPSMRTARVRRALCRWTAIGSAPQQSPTPNLHPLSPPPATKPTPRLSAGVLFSRRSSPTRRINRPRAWSRPPPGGWRSTAPTGATPAAPTPTPLRQTCEHTRWCTSAGPTLALTARGRTRR
mmetsp:Transcript_27704/g.89517  ORF Transcript_27704/g.89517 Transcript_27704/m.89517 type:complete len:207 (-) Transcript_27704:32-652(-)